jgi:hypothetical protein
MNISFLEMGIGLLSYKLEAENPLPEKIWFINSWDTEYNTPLNLIRFRNESDRYKHIQNLLDKWQQLKKQQNQNGR